jgi:hypothetical protein
MQRPAPPPSAAQAASGPATNLALGPATNPAPELVRSCDLDQVRLFLCGERQASAARCPARVADLARTFSWNGVFRSGVEELQPDDELTSRYNREAAAEACCYSRCVPVAVHAKPVSATSYRSVTCLPAMATSRPTASHPRCPAAIALPGDFPGHIAAFDRSGTQARSAAWRAEPLLRDVAWCCYGSAPAAAVGPM